MPQSWLPDVLPGRSRESLAECLHMGKARRTAAPFPRKYHPPTDPTRLSVAGGIVVVQDDKQEIETGEQGVGQPNVAGDGDGAVVVPVDGVGGGHHAMSLVGGGRWAIGMWEKWDRAWGWQTAAGTPGQGKVVLLAPGTATAPSDAVCACPSGKMLLLTTLLSDLA